MWKEYAIEPECLTRSLTSCHRILDGVGWETGRLVSEYPRNWRKLIWEGLNRHDQESSEFKKLLERLAAFASPDLPARVAGGFISGRRSGVNAGANWVERAKAGHAHEPFDCIVASSAVAGAPEITCFDMLFDSGSAWRSPPSRTIARTNPEVVSAAKHLLRESERVILIDYYLDPADRVHRHTIEEIFAAMSQNSGRKHLRLHTCKPRGLNKAAYEHNVRQSLEIFPGEVFECVVWDESNATERFHDRFLISDLGGLGIQGGLDSANPSQHTSAYRLGTEDRMFWLLRFEGTPPAFTELCRFTI